MASGQRSDAHDQIEAFASDLDERDLGLAQIESFARQTPVNAFVTISVAVAATIVLWGHVSRAWLLSWASCHVALSLFLTFRWWTRRGRRIRKPAVERLLSKAKFLALVSGALWGAMALFFPTLPLPQLLLACFMLGGIAAGASTTLAAIPPAAALYQASCILPAALYLALQGEALYTVVAALALVLAIGMLASTGIVYSSFLEAAVARARAAALLETFEAARSEWLAIAESASGFALFDPDDRLLLWNDNFGDILSLPKAALFRGGRMDAVLARAAKPLPPPKDAEHLWLTGTASFNRDRPRDVVQLENERWVRSDSRRTESGHTVMIHEDVTELTRAMSELHRSRQKELLGQLSAGVAHDFNNLLTVIIGNLDLLRSLVSVPRYRRLLDQAMDASNRGAQLVERLLVFARQQPLSPRPVDVNRQILEAESLLRRTIGPSIVIQTELAPDLWPAMVDPVQLENAIVNLSLNARDAMPTGGTLRFETVNINCALEDSNGRSEAECSPGDYVRLTVKDDGAGMAQEVRERAVEPFFTTKGIGKGSGLGLSMVYGFAKASLGHIEIDSTPDRFTAVTLYLPRADADGLEEPTAGLGGQATPSSR